MKYEIVELNEKMVVGFGARTSNEDPEMSNIIGQLWEQLYNPENSDLIMNRVNAYSIGLYSDYDNAGYQVIAGFEVSKFEGQDNLVVKVIPAGKYAKFSIHGENCIKAVGDTWSEIWQTPLERTYTGDFEEYISMEDVDIYIAIR